LCWCLKKKTSSNSHFAHNGAARHRPGRPAVFLAVANKHLNPSSRSGWSLLAVITGLVVGLGWQAPPAPTQAQVAYRFLTEVVRADYPAAYRRLAPEVRATLPRAAFSSAARPLRQLGKQRGRAIELYTFGTHLSERGGGEPWFYRFSFAQDSLQKPPLVLLEVTFRDTTTREVLGFRVRNR